MLEALMIGISARCLGLALPAILLAACSSPPSVTYAPEDASAEDATTDATQDAKGEAAPPSDGGSSDADAARSDGGDAGITDGATDAPADSPPPVYAATKPIGANIPYLFLGFLGTAPGGAPGATSSLADAKAAGITHVRFIASGFYPDDMTTGMGWVADPTDYWAAMDATVAAAGAAGIKLVPSILWNVYLFPDINSEPAGQLFVKGSKTRTMAEQYITQLVTRYASSDGILYWEIGNELNLSADIDVSDCNVCDGGTNYCAALDPPKGTPCERTAVDEYYSCNTCRGMGAVTQEDLGAFSSDIAVLIAGIDTKHPVSSGDSYPTPYAWHLAASPCPACDYTLDSKTDYQSALLELHPTGVDIVSVHHYPGPGLARFGSNDATGSALLALTQQIASTSGKTLYVGEFGEPRSGTVNCNGALSCSGEATWAQSRWVLDDLLGNGVPSAALWGFDFFQYCPAVPTCNSVIPTDAIVGSLTLHNEATTACAADGGAAGDAGVPDGAVAPEGGTPCPVGSCVGAICTPEPGSTFGLDSASAVSAWTLFTNCTGCTPGTDAFEAFDAGGGYLTMASNTLPCTGACTNAGVYALSPKFPMPDANALVRFDAYSSSASAVVDFIPYDATGTELTHTPMAVTQGATFTTSALWFQVPAGTVTAAVRFELTSPTSTMAVDDVAVVSEP
jgi:hypothetical protein